MVDRAELMPIARGAPKDVPMSVSHCHRTRSRAITATALATGSIARQMLVVTDTGTVGVMAVFGSDFAKRALAGADPNPSISTMVAHRCHYHTSSTDIARDRIKSP